MTTALPKTAEPSALNADLAAAVASGRVIDTLTGLPIPRDRKRARALAGTPCRRILAPRVAAGDEIEEIAGRLGDLRLRHRDAVAYDAEDGAAVLLVTAYRPEVGCLMVTTYRRDADGVWSTDRVTVSREHGSWRLDRSAPYVVETTAEAEAVQASIMDDALDAAGVLLAHIADTRAVVDNFFRDATMDEFCQATMGCSIQDIAANILDSGGRATLRMTLPL